MRVWLLITLSFLLVPCRGARAAQCKADFDGSGAVEINELIAAVNEALSGCSGGGATPTRKPATPTRTPTTAPADTCPYKFNQAVGTDRFCGYEGQVQPQHCDAFHGRSGWTTQSDEVIGLFIDDFGNSLALDSQRTSPTTARVTAISFGPDFEQAFDASGSLSLPSVKRFMATFDAGGTCGKYTQNGMFYDLLGDNAVRAAMGIAGLRAELRQQFSAAAVVRDDGRAARARALLRAMHR